jgi:transcriptional regulator with XRE-family HTH domain
LKSLGKRIQSVRKSRGWTQARLAEALGIKTGTLSGYERDYRRPDVVMLGRMASILHVSVDYLLGREDVFHPEDPKGEARREEALKSEAHKDSHMGLASERAGVPRRDPLVDLAIEAISELSPEGRQAVERFLEYCRDSDRLRRDRAGQNIRKSE